MPPRQSKTCCSSLLTCVSRSELLLVLLSPPHRQSESPSASFFCSLRLNKYVQCLSLFTCILQSVSLSFLLSPPLRQSKPCCQLFSHSYLPAATPVFVVICVTQTSNITWYLTLLPSPPKKKMRLGQCWLKDFQHLPLLNFFIITDFLCHWPWPASRSRRASDPVALSLMTCFVATLCVLFNCTYFSVSY